MIEGYADILFGHRVKTCSRKHHPYSETASSLESQILHNRLSYLLYTANDLASL